jgi:hypothetical protein
MVVVVVEHRPTERPTMKRRRKKDVYMRLKFHEEENEKKSKEGENEEEEGCTYTNAIKRVSTQVEKKRRKSFLVRDACCCVIVDENEVHPYYHHHHLFFLISMLILYVKNYLGKRKEKKERWLHSVLARFLSQVHSVFFLSASFILLCR